MASPPSGDGKNVLLALGGMVLLSLVFWTVVGPGEDQPSPASGAAASASPTAAAAAAPTAAPAAPSAAPPSGGDVLVLETTKGVIKARLDRAKAPLSAGSVARYAGEGFYDGLVFHRVVKGFVIQAGGFKPGMVRKDPAGGPIKNEATNGLKNKRGTLAMARTSEPDSATSQFYINLVDNAMLDHPRPDGSWGYAVFGEVVEGMDVVDAIAAVPVGTRAGMENVPVEDVVITRSRME